MDHKMKADEILKLIDAGYTKAEIEAMETTGQDQNQEQNQDQNQDQNQGQEKNQEQNQDQNQGREQNQDQNQEYKNLENKISETQNQLQQLIKQMQKNNLQTAGINILPDNVESAADKAMSELIRPTIKKEGEK